MKQYQEYSGRKILITGANGYIGPHLYRQLCRSGAEVHAVSRRPPLVDGECPRWWKADLTDFKAVCTIMDAVKPDVVFHLAGYAAGSRDIELVLPTFHSNLTTTVNILTAAAATGCRRIILPGSLEEPDSTAAEVVPSSPYAAGKWASSAYARMFHKLYKTPVVILRIFMTYGPGRQNPGKLIPFIITSLLRGQSPGLSSGQRRIDWIYIDDVIDGLLSAALAPEVEGKTIDLGSGILLPIRTIGERLSAMVNASVSPSYGALADRPMEQVRAANIEETYKMIGWKPMTSLEEGLVNTVSWYKEHLHEIEKFSAQVT
jgi:UDP-glucose 4-epimerase